MLQQLDVAIAIVVVLLGVSLFVTILTQMISSLLNLRGSHLRAGLVTLLKTADPGLEAHADAIVARVVTHPLLSDSAFSQQSPFKAKDWVEKRMPALAGHWRCASAVRPNELKAILRELVAAGANSSEPWHAALATALGKDPDRLLDRARVTLDELKKGLTPAAAARLQSSIDSAVSSISGVDARIDEWFDAAMNRVSQRFTLNVRVWTAGIAVAVAILMHFDAIDLYNKVAADKSVRDSLVSMAGAVQTQAEQDLSNKQTRTIDDLSTEARELRSKLAVAQFQLDVPTWPEHVRRFGATGWGAGIVGILIGAALLSLGSPFWFNALKGLTSLKTTVASAIDHEKQSAAPAAAAGRSAAARV